MSSLRPTESQSGTTSPEAVPPHSSSSTARRAIARTGQTRCTHLPARHRVVAIDLAGHGESGDGREAWTMASFGGDVTAVVEELGLDDLVLIGHSMGGDVIVEAALGLADRVRALVWVDTVPPRSTSSRARLRSLPSSSRSEQTSLRRHNSWFRGMFPSDADPDWSIASRSTCRPRRRPSRSMPCATRSATASRLLERLPLRASRSSRSTPTTARPMRASLRRHGVRPILMSGVGHFLMIEDPDRFNGVLGERHPGVRLTDRGESIRPE